MTQGVSIELEGVSNPAGLDSPGWRDAEIRYKPGKQPVVVDVSRVGDDDELLAEEVGEFVEFLDDVEESVEKRRVLAHLGQSRAVVGVQLLNDVDDDGYSAAGLFLAFFVTHCGGLIQSDGEGFYEGDNLIIELE